MAVDRVRRPHARDAAWDSAFYRFAEGVRALTGGQVNYRSSTPWWARTAAT